MAALADLGETWLPHRAPHTDAVGLTVFIFLDWDSGQVSENKNVKESAFPSRNPTLAFQIRVSKVGP